MTELARGHLPGYPDEIKNNVRDWILFQLAGVPFFDPWPNFNIADVMLVSGAIMLFVHAFMYAEPNAKESVAGSGGESNLEANSLTSD